MPAFVPLADARARVHPLLRRVRLVGDFFSNFYGGVLVGSSQLVPATERINAVKASQNLHGEIKWQKVTANYLEKYKAVVDALFDELEAGTVKLRIMFTQNSHEPTALSDEQRRLSYWLLYYQFVKHAFGFSRMPPTDLHTHLRVYFDQFPQTGEEAAKFKDFIEALERSAEFKAARLRIRRHDIAEVDSHDHALLQCLDVVLGAICFRLNDKHLVKPAGSRVRGSRTIAKEKLYRHIHQRICALRPNFNIGITTGGGAESRWSLPYCHWRFLPREHKYDQAKTKGGRNKKPT